MKISNKIYLKFCLLFPVLRFTINGVPLMIYNFARLTDDQIVYLTQIITIVGMYLYKKLFYNFSFKL